MRVLGRDGETGPIGRLGSYRARDGSEGAGVGLDLDRPHVALIVGKRGYGKSHTVGVIAEELARGRGTSPVLVDPMGDFRSLAEGDAVPSRHVEPTVAADDLGPRDWCDLLDLDPAGATGSLVWRAAAEAADLDGLREAVAEADAAPAPRRAALNHLRLAAAWDVFDPDGLGALGRGACATLDVAGFGHAAANAVVAGAARRCYDERIQGRIERLPWLLVDEAHAFFDGIAASGLRRLCTRGRGPGVSLVAATQRPSALPDVAISQADLLVVHRLTSRADREALAAARPAYMTRSLADRMPTGVGEALVIDDATETVHTIRVRERDTPHDGASPRASEMALEAAETDSESCEMAEIDSESVE